jgi:hypothetical protein
MLQASAISKVPPGKVVSNDRQPLPRARTLLLGMIAKSPRPGERDNRACPVRQVRELKAQNQIAPH